MATKREVLQQLSFGKRVAEEERDSLIHYFVETDQWRRIYAGEVDIVYGPKGSGKSALHWALLSREKEFRARAIELIAAENPRGAPAFKELVDEPPASEREFVGLWKIYLLTLAAGLLKDRGAVTTSARIVVDRLGEAGLIQVAPERNLKTLLAAVRDFVRKQFQSLTVQPEVKFDPAGNVTSVSSRISFSEPKPEAARAGVLSVDALLRTADKALGEMGSTLWILLDRLDVAFAESRELEENALRALFKTYLDVAGLENLRLKVFLRSDIWKRITGGGFREASHITSHVTIEWGAGALLNLVVRRTLQNKLAVEFYAADVDTILASQVEQDHFFYRVFPDKIEPSYNKPSTFDWLLGRTRDGTQQNTPRELIHLLNKAREVQLAHLDMGRAEPEGERLFTNSAVKEALPEVSKTRLEQTLYAEYPRFREPLEKLRGEKALQTPITLGAIWGVAPKEAEALALDLVNVGFFERRGSRDAPEFWVPLLYRDALDLIQGRAE